MSEETPAPTLLESSLGPPSNEAPVSVAFDAELLANDRYALFCSGLHVYSTGFRVQLALRARDQGPDEALFEVFHRGGPDQVHIGVELADGRWGRHVGWGSGQRESGHGVLVLFLSGGGGDRAVDADFFVTPLPPPGSARLVCAWPSRGLGDTMTELPVTDIVAAAGRVRQLWPSVPQVVRDEQVS